MREGEVVGPDGPGAASSAGEEPGSGATRERLGRFLDHPLTGYVPWVALYVLEGPGRTTSACAIALAMSCTGLVLVKLRGTEVRLLSCVDIFAFTGFLIGSLVAAPSTVSWFEDWFSTAGNLFLFAVVTVTLVIRKPFTLPYAKEQTEPEFWDSPAFVRVNDVVTAMWALAFLVGAVAGLIGTLALGYDDNIWTGWLVQIVAVMVAVAFTAWYGPRTMAATREAAGRPTDPPAPVWEFWAIVATYLVPIGVVSLVFDGGPAWLGIAMVCGGLISATVFRARAKAQPPPAPTAGQIAAGTETSMARLR
mgnify:CR=1 FL=1